MSSEQTAASFVAGGAGALRSLHARTTFFVTGWFRTHAPDRDGGAPRLGAVVRDTRFVCSHSIPTGGLSPWDGVTDAVMQADLPKALRMLFASKWAKSCVRFMTTKSMVQPLGTPPDIPAMLTQRLWLCMCLITLPSEFEQIAAAVHRLLLGSTSSSIMALHGAAPIHAAGPLFLVACVLGVLCRCSRTRVVQACLEHVIAPAHTANPGSSTGASTGSSTGAGAGTSAGAGTGAGAGSGAGAGAGAGSGARAGAVSAAGKHVSAARFSLCQSWLAARKGVWKLFERGDSTHASSQRAVARWSFAHRAPPLQDDFEQFCDGFWLPRVTAECVDARRTLQAVAKSRVPEHAFDASGHVWHEHTPEGASILEDLKHHAEAKPAAMPAWESATISPRLLAPVPAKNAVSSSFINPVDKLSACLGSAEREAATPPDYDAPAPWGADRRLYHTMLTQLVDDCVATSRLSTRAAKLAQLPVLVRRAVHLSAPERWPALECCLDVAEVKRQWKWEGMRCTPSAAARDPESLLALVHCALGSAARGRGTWPTVLADCSGMLVASSPSVVLVTCARLVAQALCCPPRAEAPTTRDIHNILEQSRDLIHDLWHDAVRAETLAAPTARLPAVLHHLSMAHEAAAGPVLCPVLFRRIPSMVALWRSMAAFVRALVHAAMPADPTGEIDAGLLQGLVQLLDLDAVCSSVHGAMSAAPARLVELNPAGRKMAVSPPSPRVVSALRVLASIHTPPSRVTVRRSAAPPPPPAEWRPRQVCVRSCRKR